MAVGLTLVLAFLIFALARWLLKCARHYVRPQGFPPGPSQWPILGSVPYLPKELRNKEGLHMPRYGHYQV